MRLQRQALGALVALEDATCSSAGAVAVLMLDVSHMMQEPSMKHQKLPRHPARLPSSLDPLVQGSEKMSQVGISLHQPKNATVESLFQNGNCQLVPCELVRHRKQAHKFPKVGYVLLAPHLLVLHEEAQLLLDGIVEAGTPAFEQEPRLRKLRASRFGVRDYYSASCSHAYCHHYGHDGHRHHHQTHQHLHRRASSLPPAREPHLEE